MPRAFRTSRLLAASRAGTKGPRSASAGCPAATLRGWGRRSARVLRVPQSRATWAEADSGGRLAGRCIHPVGAHAEPAVRRADEGKAGGARIGRIRIGSRRGRIRAVGEPAPGGRGGKDRKRGGEGK